VTTLLIVLVAVGLIGVSPFALGLFHGTTVRWERLSFIGQTYGAASAVVAVVALVGVVVTLRLQAREIARAREATRRQAHTELLKMAMEDPDLEDCWGPVEFPDDPKMRKQQLYTNMILTAWETSFEMKLTPEHRLRAHANEMFQGQPGRDFWQSARELRLTTWANRHERRFQEILDEEYRRALAEHPRAGSRPDRPPPEGPLRSSRAAMRRRLLWAGIGTGALAALYRMLRSRPPPRH